MLRGIAGISIPSLTADLAAILCGWSWRRCATELRRAKPCAFALEGSEYAASVDRKFHALVLMSESPRAWLAIYLVKLNSDAP